MAEYEDLKTWGNKEGLPEYVINILQAQGINTKNDLNNLSDGGLEVFQAAGILDSTQCAQLRSAIRKSRASQLGSDMHFGRPAYGDARHDQGSSSRENAGYPGRPAYSDARHDQGFSSRENAFYTHGGSDFTSGTTSYGFSSAARGEGTGNEAYGRSASHGSGYGSAGYGPSDRMSNDFSHMRMDAGGETFRVVLLGRTGSGKSTTGNTILGKQEFDTGASFASVTYDCKRAVGRRGNIALEVMDCVGLFDTTMKHEEICKIVIQAVAGMHPGPHALLYVVRIGRYTQEEHGAYRRLKALFDDSVTNYMILVLTGGDVLRGARGPQACDEVARMIGQNGPKELQEVFRECGQRIVVFDNMAADKESQVQYFFQQIRNLNARNRNTPYTCPRYAIIGDNLEAEVTRRVQIIEKEDAKRQKYVQQLEREKKSAEESVERTQQQIKHKEEEWKMKDMEETRKREMMEDDHKRKMDEQARMAKEQQDNLLRIMKEKDEADSIMREREREMNEQEKQQMREEAETRRQEQDRIQQMLSDIEERREKEKQEYEQRFLQMQQQYQNDMAEREQERKREFEELEKQRQEAEEKREQQRRQEREDDERRYQTRLEEMEKLKQKVVDDKEPGFLDVVKNVLLVGVGLVLKRFGFP